MKALNRGYYVTSFLAVWAFSSQPYMLQVDPAQHPEASSAWFYFFLWV